MTRKIRMKEKIFRRKRKEGVGEHQRTHRICGTVIVLPNIYDRHKYVCIQGGSKEKNRNEKKKGREKKKRTGDVTSN